MSKIVANQLADEIIASTADAENGVAGKYPDAADVLAAIKQFGLGKTLTYSNTNLNDRVLGWTGATSGAPNSPPNFPSGIVLTLEITTGTDVRCAQFFQSTNEQVYIRHKVPGTPSAWREIFHTGNIVGTVSESGGVPTGSIIERGSNANGQYTKFADGSLLCYRNIQLTQAQDYQMLATWTFPAAFSSTPSVSHCPWLNTASGYAAVAGDRVNWGVPGIVIPTASNARLDLYRSFSAPAIPSGSTIETFAIAIGRWF